MGTEETCMWFLVWLATNTSFNNEDKKYYIDGKPQSYKYLYDQFIMSHIWNNQQFVTR